MASKRKILHIISPYPKGEAPSQRFRFEQYLHFLEGNDFQIKYHAFHSQKSWDRLYKPGQFGIKSLELCWNFIRRFGLLFRLIGAKHIFVHREMTHIGPPVFEWILVKILRRTYIYDFDDAIWIPNYSVANARFQKLKCYWKVTKLMRWASVVSAGNDYLADYARQFNANVVRIPTTIDTEHHHNLHVDHDESPVVIGWTGTHSTMRYLDPLIPILQKLEHEFTFELRIISNKCPDFPLNSMVYQAWNLETEIEDLTRFHIGLMPLVEDQWSAGKCGFKALQYMALGSVAIVSPIGVNTQIVQHGENGYLAQNPEDWEGLLRQLLANPELRKKTGKVARQSIETRWSVNAWKETYLNLFE
jgi:glycosyltransferase involved in cell wall biosynthesis